MEHSVLGVRQRIAHIFLPSYMRSVKNRYGNELDRPTARFAHYTSAESALKIILTKRFWMRNTTCMVDYAEVQHGWNLLRGFFSNQTKRQALYDAVNACAPGAAEQSVHAFEQRFGEIMSSTYITSISEHDEEEDEFGRLSMWRAFGTTGPRVAMVFSLPLFSEPALESAVAFSPVIYSTDKAFHESFEEVIENLISHRQFLQTLGHQEIVSSVVGLLARAVTCMKHKGFHEEREWRALYMPTILRSKLLQPSVEVIGGVPQTLYKLPMDKDLDPAVESLDFSRIFDRLIVGPSQYPLAIGQAFAGTLAAAGVTDAPDKVVVSSIPIRSH